MFLAKKVGDFIKKESESFVFVGLKIPRDYEIAKEGYRIFKENYKWNKPIRSLGIRGSDLVNENYCEQLDFFTDARFRERLQIVDNAVDDIRRRFGYFAVQRGLMYQDKALSHLDCEAEHTVHPHTFFG